MKDLTNLPGFEYGYPPKEFNWYALWSPVLDCFVMVSYDFELIVKLQLLTMSKNPLRILELPSELYKSNKIDNQCCHLWTVQDLENINLNTMYQTHPVPKCKQIVPTTQQHDRTDTYREWLFFLITWIRKIQNSNNFYERFAVDVLQATPSRPNRVNEIYRELLFGEDISITEQKIQQILNNSHANQPG